MFGAVRSLALTWGPRNQIPRQFLGSRCVQIPKGSKVMEGCISARDLRPITIQSCFWRLWASVLLRSAPMKQWIAQAMPAEVISGCGPKAEAQIAAASVLHGVSVEGYGCTLDFTKCYDSLDPRGTVSLLQAAGLPDSWVNTLIWFGLNSPGGSCGVDVSCLTSFKPLKLLPKGIRGGLLPSNSGWPLAMASCMKISLLICGMALPVFSWMIDPSVRKLRKVCRKKGGCGAIGVIRLACWSILTKRSLLVL